MAHSSDILAAAIAVSGFPLMLVAASTIPAVRYTRRGGMRFLRVGRVQMSWCVCRAALGSEV